MTRRLPPFVAALLAALAVSGLFALDLESLDTLERWSLDLRFTTRGPVAPGEEVVIVAVDDRTMTEDPELFAHRAGFARLVRGLTEGGAKVIGVDALFVEPERLLGEALGREVEAYFAGAPGGDAAARALLEKIRAALDGDGELEAALREAGNVVLAMHVGQTGGPAVDPRALAKGRFGQSVPGSGLPQGEAVLASLAKLDRASAALGTVTLIEDADLAARSLRMATGHGQAVFAPFSLQVLARFLDVSRARLAYTGDAVHVGELQIPLEPGAELLLNYRGDEDAFPTVSAVDVAAGRVPSAKLAGKMALVGMTYLGNDKIRTPFSRSTPGVLVHATAIDNVLRGDVLRRLPRLWGLGAIFVLGLLVAALFAGQRLPAWAQILGALLLLGGWALAAQVLFTRAHLWIPVVGPLASGLMAVGVGLTTSYLREGLERRRLRKAFSRYLADDVIEALMHDPAMAAPGGTRRELTVLFSDVRNFTSFAERLSPEEVVGLLNAYLAPMTRAVLEGGGLLDKYIGDAVMAVFGAPVRAEDHAARGLRTALAMHQALGAVRPAFAAKGVPLEIGVGVNTGEMVVGNMGSADRFDYTVVGDAVNLASRLESLTKTYGVFCLVGAATRAQAGPGFTFREVDRVRVKGKARAESLFELLSGEGLVVARYDALARFEDGVAAWRGGRFEEAREAFTAFAASNPADQATRLYLERLARVEPTELEGWDGVTTLAHK